MTFMMYKNNINVNIANIFNQFYPKELEYTYEIMNNNCIKFLDILIIKINNTIQYIMQIKPLKIEFLFHIIPIIQTI